MKWLGPTWVTIDLDALQHNLNHIKQHASTPICAVVKGDAYGHGLKVISHFYHKQVQYLAVSDLAEALEVRAAAPQTSILVLNPILPQQTSAIASHKLTVTVNCPMIIQALANQGKLNRQIIKVHLKVDTGMNRVGVSLKEAAYFAKLIKEQPYLHLEGIYTHFAAAQSDPTYTMKQLTKFKQLKQSLENQGITNLMWHCANSAAFVNLPESHLDLVRVGTLLYGQSTTKLPNSWHLKTTWHLFSRIIQVKSVAKNESIGYGLSYKLKRNSIIGIIPIGYSDGLGVDTRKHTLLHKLIHKPPYVIIDDYQYPVIGKIAMGMCCIDLTEHPQARNLYGVIVKIPAKRVLINQRLPKVYLQNKKVSCIYFQNKIWQAMEKNGQVFLKDKLHGR